jgi:hypothetical protein
MNKKYFAKYLSVEGEIKEGDPVQIDGGQVILYSSKWQNTFRKFNRKKVKLFLCSRDIQVGDKVTFNDGTTSEVPKDYPLYILREGSACTKVIGEISSNASWVKEGDEFDEEDIKYHCVFVNPFGEFSHYGFTEKEFLTKNLKSYPQDGTFKRHRGMWFVGLYIKGPCGHFH